ncbi:flagellar motor protein MotB [Halorhodospira neutriphila]|uniref:OmpA-like domain-containing protein n=1 Tax=Halorhodospira neutriphila TaxID=168379 RepID=A0ABS1E3G7_9GAMM|nr:flagellar motor protein MotB [Halorhodospira neutriphila]MBK1725779.1 hypothetical protein [Halorhodospira neutriphila]
MVDENKTRPIVIKRVKKGGGEHHGGSWKIAFADFMTAMFAIFLVLWLLLALDEQQRAGIGQYFRNPAAFEEKMNSSEVIDFEGQKSQPIDFEGLPVGREGWVSSEEMEQLAAQFRRAIRNTPGLDEYREQIRMDITDDGLRVQLVDQDEQPLFELGSAALPAHTERILRELAEALQGVPNTLSIAGHTDARSFADQDYDNWSLSTDRANAARRTLREAGIPSKRIGQVVGYADTVPYNPDDPRAAVNRRISVVLLTPEAAQGIAEREVQGPSQQGIGPGSGAGQGGGILPEGEGRQLLTPEERNLRERPRPDEGPSQGSTGDASAGPSPAEQPGQGGADGEPADREPRQLLEPDERQRPEPQTW